MMQSIQAGPISPSTPAASSGTPQTAPRNRWDTPNITSRFYHERMFAQHLHANAKIKYATIEQARAAAELSLLLHGPAFQMLAEYGRESPARPGEPERSASKHSPAGHQEEKH